jgi:hypothetical protein
VIDVYGRGSNGALYQREYNSNAWSSWTSLGGQLAANTGPAACSWGQGRLDVFVQGTNGALYHRGYTGTWSAWESLGGKLTSSPGATSRGSGIIDAFVRGTDGALWETSYNSGRWSAWRSIGGGVDTGLNQGIANDGTYNYGITTTALYKYDANWNQIAANTNAGAQVGVNHLGDGCVHNGVLYVAACDWASCGSFGNSRIGKWNTADLSYIGYVDISAQHFDAAGCSIDTADGFLWVGSYCNADGTYYKYNMLDLSPGGSVMQSPAFIYAGSITPSPAFRYVQGIEYYGGYLFVSVQDIGIIRMNLNGSGQKTIIPCSALNSGEVEGLDVNRDYVRVLCGRQVFTFVNNY